MNLLRRTEREIVVFETDWHGGFTLGLCNPDVELLDEAEDGTLTPYSPRLTATQEYLWRGYLADVAEVEALAGKDPVKLIHLGDLCHGKRYLEQLMSTRLADQVTVAVSNFAPYLALKNLESVTLVQGTAAHGFGEGSAEVLVAGQLGAQIRAKTIRHLLASVQAVKLDASHHGPAKGIRVWTEANVAKLYLRDRMQREALRGRKPPEVYIRAHHHAYLHVQDEMRRVVDSKGEVWVSDLYIVPARCGLSEYAQKATQSEYLVYDGCVAFEIAGGKITAHPFWREVDLRTEETL